MGMRTWKRVSPGTDVNVMLPRILRTMRWTESSPRPVPSPTPFVVKKGSKMRDCTSLGMPEPLSPISTRTSSPSRTARRLNWHFVFHGVSGVVYQVGPDLIEFAAIGGDLGKIWRKIANHGDAFAEFVLKDGKRGFQAANYVHFLHRRLVHVGIFFDGFRRAWRCGACCGKLPQ